MSVPSPYSQTSPPSDVRCRVVSNKNEQPKEDCRDYLRTGRCKYGASCKYNHPLNVQSGGGMKAPINPSEPLFPIRYSEPVCQYYMKHGTCKFGQACKFHHPPEVAGTGSSNVMNGNNAVLVSVPIGGRKDDGCSHPPSMWRNGKESSVQILPQRPNEPNCIFFLKNGRCKYGATCRYHHPLNGNRNRSGYDDGRNHGINNNNNNSNNNAKPDVLASQRRFLKSDMGRALTEEECRQRGRVVATEINGIPDTIGSQLLITVDEGPERSLDNFRNITTTGNKESMEAEAAFVGTEGLTPQTFRSVGMVVEDDNDVLGKINSAYCDANGRPYADIRVIRALVIEDPYEDPAGMDQLLEDRGVVVTPVENPQISAHESDDESLAALRHRVSTSPDYERPPEETVEIRISASEIVLDDANAEQDQKKMRMLKEQRLQREDKSRAVVLEMLGDLPSADVKAPENVLFVCKLNSVTEDEDLELIFSRFDEKVSVEIVRDHKTGASLQYAFVEFTTKEKAAEAYFKMNNALVDDRRIKVDFSQSVAKVWDRFNQRHRKGLSSNAAMPRDPFHEQQQGPRSRHENKGRNNDNRDNHRFSNNRQGSSHSRIHDRKQNSRDGRYNDRSRRERNSDRDRNHRDRDRSNPDNRRHDRHPRQSVKDQTHFDRDHHDHRSRRHDEGRDRDRTRESDRSRNRNDDYRRHESSSHRKDKKRRHDSDTDEYAESDRHGRSHSRNHRRQRKDKGDRRRRSRSRSRSSSRSGEDRREQRRSSGKTSRRKRGRKSDEDKRYRRDRHHHHTHPSGSNRRRQSPSSSRS